MEAIASEKPNFVTVILGLSLIVLPFIGSDAVLDETLTPRFIFLNGVILVLLVFQLFQKETQLNWNPVKCSLPLLLLALLYGVSIAYAPVTSEAIFWWTKVSSYALFFFMLTVYQTTHQIQWRKLAFFALAAVFISWLFMLNEMYEVGGIGFLELDQKLQSINGGFGHKNLYASYLLLLTGLIAMTYHQQNNSIKRLIIAVFLVNIVFFVFLQTKAVVLALFLSSLIVLIPFFKRVRNKKRVLLGSGIFVCILIVFMMANYEQIINIVFTGSLQERFLIWDNTTEMIAEQPLLGGGAGSFQINFPQYGLEKFSTVNPQIALAYQTFQRPHNDYLWICSEVGVVGVVLYITFFAVFIYRAVKLLIIGEKQENNKALIFLFFLLSYLVISFFDFPWERSEHQLVLMMFLAAFTPVTNPLKDLKQRGVALKNMLLLALLAVVAFNSYYLVGRFSMEKQSKTIVEAHATGNWRLINSSYAAVDPFFYQINNFSIPLVWYSGVAAFAQNDLKKGHNDFHKAYQINPYQIHVINNYAGSHLKKGDLEKAIALYDEALSIHPRHREILLNKAIAFYQNEKHEKAFQAFVEIDYNPDWSPLYNKAFTLIFNSYLDQKVEHNPDGYVKSWQNIKESDSLKRVIIYEYHHNQKDWDKLLNRYNY